MTSDIGEPTGHDPAPFSTDDCRCPQCLALEAKVFRPLHPIQAITDPPFDPQHPQPAARIRDFLRNAGRITD